MAVRICFPTGDREERKEWNERSMALREGTLFEGDRKSFVLEPDRYAAYVPGWISRYATYVGK